MAVLVAIDTFYSNIPETPFVSLFMAVETGCGQMGPGQLKVGLIVPFNGIFGLFKSQG